MFFKGSRYEKVEEAELTNAGGRVVRYKKVRFITDPQPQGAHRVEQGDRLDLISYSYFQDPERFWRIADANRGLWPDDLLEEPGRLILVPATED